MRNRIVLGAVCALALLPQDALPQQPNVPTPKTGATVILIDRPRKVTMTRALVRRHSSGPETTPSDRFPGGHAKTRTTNIMPQFEVTVPADVNPSAITSLVRLRVTPTWRTVTISPDEVDVRRFTRDDSVQLVLEHGATSSTDSQYRTYRAHPFQAIGPGEYALYVNGVYFDFAVVPE